VAFLLLFFFIWSVLGVVLFGNLCAAGDEALEPLLRSTRCLLTDPDSVLSAQAHFQSVEWTLITLFRVSTGDAWGDVMGALQLANSKRSLPVPDATWKYYTSLLGSDPSEVVPGLHKGAAEAHLQLAALALTNWNASMTGLNGNDPDNADAWAAGARLALPNCLSEDEALWLSEKGLMDCRVPYKGELFDTPCSSTCGGMNQPWVANLYLMAFVCISSIILLQLVIAVLMDQFTQVICRNPFLYSIKRAPRFVKRVLHFIERVLNSIKKSPTFVAK